MAKMTSCLIEQLFARLNIGIIDITASWNGQSLHIQVYTFHLFRTDIEHIIGESHHRPFFHLKLSLADLFRIAAVGHTHVAGESEFDSQVSMLGLIT